jgi:hypothetical protein
MPHGAQTQNILQEMAPSLVLMEWRVREGEARKRWGLMEGRYSSLWLACEDC